MSSTDRLTGQVKWFNNKTGYGFITVFEGEHTGKDIFTHYSSLRVNDTGSQYKYLVQGEYVELALVKPESGSHEFLASDVSGIKGGTIMCEVRYANQSTDRKPRHTKQSTNSDAPVEATV
jgi:cold shock CspA family protein